MNKALRLWFAGFSLLAPAILFAGGREAEADEAMTDSYSVAAPVLAEAAASVVDSVRSYPNVDIESAHKPLPRSKTEVGKGRMQHIQDSIMNSLESDSIVEFDRDIEQIVFVPKKQWVTGLSVSYTQSDQNRFQFLIVQGITGDTYSVKVSPMLAYAVSDDLVLGLKFAYQRSLTKMERAEIVIDSETEYDIDYLYRLGHNYYATAFMRNYFSIGHSKRFGFFNELQFMLGGGQSKMTTGVGQDLSGVYENNFQLNVGLAPGLAIFLNNYSAIEVNVGVLGFSYTHTKSVTDRIYEANRRSKLANFKINLFSITFGMAFYL